MGNYDRNNRRSGGRDSGRSFNRRGAHGSDRRDSRGPRRDFGRDRRPPTMHKTVCDECKAKCEVPFKPTEGKPIFCEECFKKKEGSGKSGNCEKQFAEINEKLDKILKFIESQ